MSGPFPPLVAVLVGTDHHHFDRLLEWVSDLAASGDFDFFVQHGATPLPDGLDGEPMLKPQAMSALLERADAVVTHAGPGCIMDARAHGHVPIVVPRDPVLGEHVDDHQQWFAAFIARQGIILPAYDRDELEARLRLAVLTAHMVGAIQPASGVDRFEQLVEKLLHR